MVGKYHIGGCGLVGLFRPCVYHPSRLGVLKYEEKRRRSPPHPMDGRLQAGREVLFPPPSTKHPVDREDGQWLWRLFKPHGAPNPPPPVLSGRWKESRITKALTEAVAYIPRQAVNWLPQPCLLRRHGYLA